MRATKTAGSCHNDFSLGQICCPLYNYLALSISVIALTIYLLNKQAWNIHIITANRESSRKPISITMLK
jgi:hypothetical protein